MAQEFHLKLITQRAAGGDPIIRERHLPGPELTIGRATDSDILLTDLSIDLQHAKVRFAGPGRVTLESISGVPFELNGRATQRVDFNVPMHVRGRVGAQPFHVRGANVEPGLDQAWLVGAKGDEMHVCSILYVRALSRRHARRAF